MTDPVRNLSLRHPDQDFFPSHRPIVVSNDKRVSAKRVPCPICGVGAGELCVTSTGQPITWVHRHRRRLALRAEREEGGLL